MVWNIRIFQDKPFSSYPKQYTQLTYPKLVLQSIVVKPMETSESRLELERAVMAARKREKARYSRPVEVGCFSIDKDRHFIDGPSELAVYRPPQVGGVDQIELNLSDGYPSRFVRKDEEIPDRLDNLLRWIQSHHRDLNVSSATTNCPAAANSNHSTRSALANSDVQSSCEAPPGKRRQLVNTNVSANTSKVDSTEVNEGRIPVDFVTWRGHLRKLMTTPYLPDDEWHFTVVKHQGSIYICEVETEEAACKRRNRDPFHEKACFWGRRFEGKCKLC